MLQNKDMKSEKLNYGDTLETVFIASSAEIDPHREVKLQNAEVLNINEKEILKTMLQKGDMEIGKHRCKASMEKMFITYPAEVLDKYL